MDLHLIPGAIADDAERGIIDELLGSPETHWGGADERSPYEGHVGHGGHELRDQRHLLLPALQALQLRVGYISPGGLNYAC
ncbi:MAG TPA: NADH-quinone oxidoreductase subunit E, partial [Chloroflexi bacterium]|nr:NADH-quinone oxidoreductase subunit E [Chloroflexota bacterium]